MSVVGPAGTITGLRSEAVAVGGVRLHHWIGGDPDGPPVILWHGCLSTGYAWREVAPDTGGSPATCECRACAPVGRLTVFKDGAKDAREVSRTRSAGPPPPRLRCRRHPPT